MMKKLAGKIFSILFLCFSSQLLGDDISPIWINITPTPLPPDYPSARSYSNLSYSPIETSSSPSGQLILFGGLGNQNTYLNDTWAYDEGANTWTNLTPDPIPADYPSARTQASMAFDPNYGQIILFGGLNKSGQRLNDTWAYAVEANTWTNITPNPLPAEYPSPRNASSMAFDSTPTESNPNGQLILFGGQTSSNNIDSNFCTNETWSFNGTWKKLSPQNPPTKRLLASMAFNPSSDGSSSGLLILSGGVTTDNIILQDTWSFNSANLTWNQIFTTGPSGSKSAAMAFDPTISNPILFGGLTASNQTNHDTWKFSDNTWTNITDPDPTNSPPALFAMSMVSDSISKIIMFGGMNAIGINSNQTWIFTSDEESITMPPTEIQSAQVEEVNGIVAGIMKKKHCRVDYINVIKWKAPKRGSPIVAYRIYRNHNLKNPLAIIPSDRKLIFKESNRNPNKIYHYTLVSVGILGNISKPVTVRIKGLHHCP